MTAVPAPTTSRLTFKVYAQQGAAPATDGLVRTFHRWIQERTVPDLLVDVHDYTHVPDGPGVLLVGHEGHYRVDRTDGRLGLRYVRKRLLDGDWPARWRVVVRHALEAAAALEAAPELRGALRFDAGDASARIDDRLAAPNDAATRAWAEPVLHTVLDELYGAEVELVHDSAPRRTFGVRVRAPGTPTLATLLAKLR